MGKKSSSRLLLLDSEMAGFVDARKAAGSCLCSGLKNMKTQRKKKRIWEGGCDLNSCKNSYWRGVVSRCGCCCVDGKCRPKFGATF